MGKKGKNVYQERPQSAQELRLLETQNQMMKAGIDVQKQQDDRSQQMYNDWRNNYQGMETGEISGNANRANGYSNNPNIMSRDQFNQMHGDETARLASLQDRLAGMNQNMSEPTRTTTSSTKGGR